METEFQEKRSCFRIAVRADARCAGIQRPCVMTMIQPWINRPQRHNMDVFLTWACLRRWEEGSAIRTNQ